MSIYFKSHVNFCNFKKLHTRSCVMRSCFCYPSIAVCLIWGFKQVLLNKRSTFTITSIWICWHRTVGVGGYFVFLKIWWSWQPTCGVMKKSWPCKQRYKKTSLLIITDHDQNNFFLMLAFIRLALHKSFLSSHLQRLLYGLKCTQSKPVQQVQRMLSLQARS